MLVAIQKIKYNEQSWYISKTTTYIDWSIRNYYLSVNGTEAHIIIILCSITTIIFYFKNRQTIIENNIWTLDYGFISILCVRHLCFLLLFLFTRSLHCVAYTGYDSFIMNHSLFQKRNSFSFLHGLKLLRENVFKKNHI